MSPYLWRPCLRDRKECLRPQTALRALLRGIARNVVAAMRAEPELHRLHATRHGQRVPNSEQSQRTGCREQVHPQSTTEETEATQHNRHDDYRDAAAKVGHLALTQCGALNGRLGQREV